MWRVSAAAAFWAAWIGPIARYRLGLALRLLENLPAFRVGPPLPAEEVVAAAERVLSFRVFGRLLFRTRCLKRSLVLYRLLRVHGHPAVFHVGAPRDVGKQTCRGHAWVTLEGRPLPTTPDQGYEPLYSRPAEAV